MTADNEKTNIMLDANESGLLDASQVCSPTKRMRSLTAAYQAANRSYSVCF